MTVSAAATLKADLDRLAVATWERVRWGPAWGMTLREDGITDENLFRLRVDHPYLNVRKFGSSEEVGNGADWEWWIGSDYDGWIGLRIQAKKMKHFRYDELRYRSASQTRVQCAVLVEEAQRDAAGRALFPLYCFYNGWDHADGWPKEVAWTVGCKRPANCRVVPDVRVFGCGLADAKKVLTVLETETDPLHPKHTLPLQTPWSWLMTGGLDGVAPFDGSTALELIAAALRLDDGTPNRPRYEVLPRYAEATRANWPRNDVDPSTVPATYVLTTDLTSFDAELGRDS